jgi:hypothetical protein
MARHRPVPWRPRDRGRGRGRTTVRLRDERTGETRNITVWPDYNGGRTAADVKYRFQWTFPIVVSPQDGNTVYAGAQVVFRTTNGGQSWEAISPDLTRNDKEKQRGGRLEEYYSTIFTIAESRAAQGVIWTGSDDGLGTVRGRRQRARTIHDAQKGGVAVAPPFAFQGVAP